MADKTLIEDLLSLGGDAFAHLFDARRDLKSRARQGLHTVAQNFELVSRDEFDAAFAMIAKARDAQEDIAARIAQIESRLGLLAPSKTVKKAKRNLPSVKKRKKPTAKK